MWTLVLMGASLYWYTVPYESDIDAALQKLRQREFVAGRYNPVIPFPEFPIGPASPNPGAGHKSYEDALEATGADGTRSILDLQEIADEPGFSPWPDMMAHPVPEPLLLEFFGTDKPDVETILRNDNFLSKISRGSGVYIVMRKDGKPSEIFFAGYSVD